MPQIIPEHLPKGFTVEDFKTIQQLLEKNVLVSIEAAELGADRGVIPVLCSDGDRMFDVFTHLSDTCTAANFPVQPHLIAYPGAPILLSNHSPRILGARIDTLFIYGIKTGPDMKNIRTIVIVPHWPCGMAKACNLGLIRSIELAVNGGARIERDLQACVHNVAVWLHVDYGEAFMRTYRIDQKKWLRWITDQKHGPAYPEALYLASMPL